MKAGEYLDIQGPLGNGYDLGKIAAEIKAEGRSFDKAILFGGGIGVPPMLELARRLDCHKNVVVGYRKRLRQMLYLHVDQLLCFVQLRHMHLRMIFHVMFR